MNTQDAACPNPECPMQGIHGAETLGIHSKKEKRFRCRKCGRTFVATHGTMFYRRHYDEAFISEVLALLGRGCPRQAIVTTFEIDERTVASWQAAAGQHLRHFHEQTVQQGGLDLGQVQADEVRIKTQRGVVWMALAIMVSTRLWLGGVVTRRRDKAMARLLALQVRACALCRALLVCFDGFAAYVKAFRGAFRSPDHTGRVGRPCLIEWPNVVLAQIIKRRKRGRIDKIERRVARPRVLTLAQADYDAEALAEHVLIESQGGGVLNTSYIERFNATLRASLAALARRSRCLVQQIETLESGMYLFGCLYNFCTYHESLRRGLYVIDRGPMHRRWVGRTPAMAAGLTDHRWTLKELLRYRVSAVETVVVSEKPAKVAVLARAA